MKFYSYILQVGKEKYKTVATSFEGAKEVALDYFSIPESSIKLVKETELIFVKSDDINRYFYKDLSNHNIQDFLLLSHGTIYETEKYFYLFTGSKTKEFRLHKNSKRLTMVINQKNFTH